TNPEQMLEVGREATGQDRPRHMISAGEHVAIATIPDYGELGGGLTLLDPQTGEHEFTRDIVADQSVTDLAYADGVVYAGTSIHGGLDSTPKADTAEVVAWRAAGVRGPPPLRPRVAARRPGLHAESGHRRGVRLARGGGPAGQRPDPRSRDHPQPHRRWRGAPVGHGRYRRADRARSRDPRGG